MSKATAVNGTTAPGFESVAELYAHEMGTMLEDNTQLCVYYRGERVVDLWASPAGDPGFHADSLVNIFSSGKSLECIALASLVDKGLMQFSDRIADHWPEFAQHGKEGLTVADLMRHEAGLANFDVSMPVEDLHRPHIKENRVGTVIERQTARFPKVEGSRREYHAITRGWVANEVFRRIDPEARTIGEFYEQDISAPLGADVFIGVPEKEFSRLSPINPMKIGRHLWASLRPRFLGRRVANGFFQLMGRLLRIIPLMRKGSMRKPPVPYEGMDGIGFFNKPELARGETPSANATCSARGLARVAAMMACGGSLEGREYLATAGWQALHAQPEFDDMGGLLPTRFTQGGVCRFLAPDAQSSSLERAFNEGREGFYGWMGLGGSILQWNPELELGFAFVPTRLHMLDLFNERGKRYQAEVLRCVSALSGDAQQG